MTTHEEQTLRKLVNEDLKMVVWWPQDKAEARRVHIVQRKAGEPSLCAVFANGEYAALYNCGLDEFKLVTDI